MQQALAQERPPYVEFYYLPVEDRAASIKAGHRVDKNVEFVKIIPPGGDLVLEKEVTEELRIRFSSQYQAWKSGEEIPVDGTAVKTWPPLSPAEVKNLLQANIRTVEDLAIAPDEAMRHIGMGAIALKQKAKAWLDAAKDTGKIAEEIVALKVKVEALEASVKEKDDMIALQDIEIKELEGRVKKAKG